MKHECIISKLDFSFLLLDITTIFSAQLYIWISDLQGQETFAYYSLATDE